MHAATSGTKLSAAALGLWGLQPPMLPAAPPGGDTALLGQRGRRGIVNLNPFTIR